jgi:DeoR/GlpR family transcriptional regulator of sugar metabolism
MMNAADEVMVVADSSKFGRSSLAHLCPLGDVDLVVVDYGIQEEWRRRLADAGVAVVVAGEGTEASTGVRNPQEFAAARQT